MMNRRGILTLWEVNWDNFQPQKRLLGRRKRLDRVPPQKEKQKPKKRKRLLTSNLRSDTMKALSMKENPLYRQSSHMLINTNTVLISQSTQMSSSRCFKNRVLWLMILLSTLKTLSFSEILLSCSRQQSSQSGTGQGSSIIYHKQMKLFGMVSAMWRRVWSSFQLRVFG